METETISALLRSWHWEPLIVLGLGSVAIGYGYAFYHFRHHGWLSKLRERGLVKRHQPWLFGAGLIAIFIALLSPLDSLAGLLFVAHMIQHILLMMVAPPLLLLGLPTPLIRWLLLETRLRAVLAWLTNPILAFTVFHVNLWMWHIPELYQAALQNPVIHDVEHALFFYTALFFWWRVLDPTGGWYPLWHWRPATWLFLIISAPPSYVLGSLLSGIKTVLYPYYDQVPRLGGLSALVDQQYGGYLMWAQGWMMVMASMILFFLWYDPSVEQGDELVSR